MYSTIIKSNAYHHQYPTLHLWNTCHEFTKMCSIVIVAKMPNGFIANRYIYCVFMYLFKVDYMMATFMHTSPTFNYKKIYIGHCSPLSCCLLHACLYFLECFWLRIFIALYEQLKIGLVFVGLLCHLEGSSSCGHHTYTCTSSYLL